MDCLLQVFEEPTQIAGFALARSILGHTRRETTPIGHTVQQGFDYYSKHGFVGMIALLIISVTLTVYLQLKQNMTSRVQFSIRSLSLTFYTKTSGVSIYTFNQAPYL